MEHDDIELIEQHDDDLPTLAEFVEHAKQHIRAFFRNKLDEQGSDIHVEDLITERNIDLVLDTTVCSGMPIIYKAIKSKKEVAKRKGKIPEDIRLALNLLNECSRRGVPKNNATGLVLIYLEVCMGCKIGV